MTDLKQTTEINECIIDLIRKQLELCMGYDKELKAFERRTNYLINGLNSLYEKYPNEYMKAIKSSSYANEIRQIRNIKIDVEAVTF